MSNNLKAARLETLHLMTRHQKAVFEIIVVVKNPNATKMQKRERVSNLHSSDRRFQQAPAGRGGYDWVTTV